MTVDHEDVRIVFTRVEDSVTQPDDLGLDADLLASFQAATWAYVGLSATVMKDNLPVATSVVYGIVEGLKRQCAFSDEIAMAWVGGDALERYVAGDARVA